MNKIDIDGILAGMDQILSRTVLSGMTSTDIDRHKQAPLLAGDRLLKRIELNRKLISKYICWQHNNAKKTDWDYYQALLTIASFSSLGILPNGLLRAWPYNPSDVNFGGSEIGFEEIPSQLLGIGRRAKAIETAQTADEKRALIAQIEWEICVGPLHPFYDGCGRISRYYSALLSILGGISIVKHKSREDYFVAARAGKLAFVEYYAAQSAT